jgi:hypothetical protein
MANGAVAPIDCHRAARQTNRCARKKDIWLLRSIEIDIQIAHGDAGLVHARSRQMRSLMLMGRSEDDLWRDVDPVLRDLLDIQGDKVVTMKIDRPGRRVLVDVN